MKVRRSKARLAPSPRLVRNGTTSLFAELTSRKLRRSAHRGVAELETDIRSWINERDKNPKPFVWTKTAHEILETLAAYCHASSTQDTSSRLARPLPGADWAALVTSSPPPRCRK